MGYLLEYDETNPISIETYGKRLIGKTFQDICDEDDMRKAAVVRETENYEVKHENKKRKGGLGELVEERYFHYQSNNDARPDFDKAGVDIIIIGRGGGSIEDLWAFNEESVARAIFNCAVPIISAVGHETDTTIADYVADLRAPTPSAAAELAVTEYSRLEETMYDYEVQLKRNLRQFLAAKRLLLRQYAIRMKYLQPYNRLREQRQQLINMEKKIQSLMQKKLDRAKYNFAVRLENMKALSPLQKLNQGFGYVTDESGKTVKSVKQTEKGNTLKIQMKDGILYAKVMDKAEEEIDGREDAGRSF